MDAVFGLVQLVVEPVVGCIKGQAGYIISSTKYVEDMRTEKKKLNDLSEYVEGHVQHNRRDRLVVPPGVAPWLENVKNIIAEVDGSDIKAGSCFNFMNRRAVGSKACKMTKRIKELIVEGNSFIWFNDRIPAGIVDSTVASTSAPASSDHSEYPSRESTFTSALEALGPDHDSSKVALLGMGGVGKSTMVEKLKEAVKKRGWFKLIVDGAVGENMNIITLQDNVATFVGISLKETTGEKARAEKLRISFEAHSKDEKIKNILVILDNVWKPFDLKDIGLDPLPNEGARFKFLLTSRDYKVCRMMGVEDNSIFYVNLLSFTESQSLFLQFARDKHEAHLDPELQTISDEIVNRCQGLPMAIRTIACTLKAGRQTKDLWEDALTRLKNHDPYDVVNDVFKLSYENLKETEAKAILLLCGVFPKDAGIPKEDLVRYGWGLKLFKKVYSIKEARQRLSTCIKRLAEVNLLSASHDAEFYNMHDLVRAFVLDMVSKGESASVVNYGEMSEWPSDDTGDLCTRISVTSTNGYEFPSGLKFPNLSFLKLTQGDNGSFKFPQDFYEGMVKLKVIGFERLVDPLLPTSFPCSRNIRVLCLHQCSLMFDYSSIGNLKNLEVLCFGSSGIEKLPSTIGNLMKLKILDLRGCFNILIDDDILRKLVNLEELYMIPSYGMIISFTDESCDGLANISKNLTTLEIEFRGRNSRPKKLSIEKLERFTIYMGHDEEVIKPYGNTMKLVACTDDILESSINELFGKTETLYLKVNDMHFLKDVMVKSPHITIYNSHFSNLKFFKVSQCSELKYLFTFNVATTLSKLEYLQISSCNKMETLIHIDNNDEGPIEFPQLKVLSLCLLPDLSGLCNTVNVIKLPQLLVLQITSLPRFTSIYSNNKLATSSVSSSISATEHLLNEQVVIPMLEILEITNMENLKEIWPCQSTGAEEIDVSKLRLIKVHECYNLVSLFPKNTMISLQRLEGLEVSQCGLIEVLFNMEGVVTPMLEMLFITNMENLKEIWPCQSTSGEEIDVSKLRIIKVDGCDNLVNLFPKNPMISLQRLEKLLVSQCGLVEVLFNMERVVTPMLEILYITNMENLKEIWPCQSTGAEEIDVSKLRLIKVHECSNLVSLFPKNTMISLQHLERLEVSQCGRVEVCYSTTCNGIGCSEFVSGEHNDIVATYIRT